jgi:UTP--glucose-1-phosphate uridylyltransferase
VSDSILGPEIFEILGDLAPGAGGEIQLTDAIRTLNEVQAVLAYNFSGFGMMSGINSVFSKQLSILP